MDFTGFSYLFMINFLSTCGNDASLAMKYCGVAREKGRTDRIKWGCPKVHMVKGEWVCDCENPCSTARKGRTSYTYAVNPA